MRYSSIGYFNTRSYSGIDANWTSTIWVCWIYFRFKIKMGKVRKCLLMNVFINVINGD